MPCAPRGVPVIGAEKAEQLRLPSADIQVMELSTKTPRRSTVYYAEPANQQAALAGFLGARGTARRFLNERNFGQPSPYVRAQPPGGGAGAVGVQWQWPQPQQSMNWQWQWALQQQQQLHLVAQQQQLAQQHLLEQQQLREQLMWHEMMQQRQLLVQQQRQLEQMRQQTVQTELLQSTDSEEQIVSPPPQTNSSMGGFMQELDRSSPAVTEAIRQLGATIPMSGLPTVAVLALVSSVLPPESSNPSATEIQRRVRQLRPAVHDRMNMLARVAPEPSPIIKPPRLPLPWDVDKERDWLAVSKNVQQAIMKARGGTATTVAIVDAMELTGTLHFGPEKSAVSNTAVELRCTRRSTTTSSQEAIQQYVNSADVLLIHNSMDVLLLVCRPAISVQMRTWLRDAGYPSAVCAMTMAAQIKGAAEAIRDGLAPAGASTGLAAGALKWLRANTAPEACPNGGSSHTGVTAEGGVHGGQLGEEGNDLDMRKVRGGVLTCKLQTTIDGRQAPSTSFVRADEYRTHSLQVRDGGGVKGVGRFGNISKPLLAPGDRTAVDCSGTLQVPSGRKNSYPMYSDSPNVAAMVFERTCRSAAADLAATFFSATPGVNTLLMMQSEFRAAQQKLAGEEYDECGCPFTGLATHLFPKGSNGLMAHKPGHDDANGPAACTLWQNLTASRSGAELEFVTVIHGHDVVVEAPLGHVMQLAAWLPHTTRTKASGPAPASDDERIHHTAYCDFKTEFAAWVYREHRLKGRPLRFELFGQGKRGKKRKK